MVRYEDACFSCGSDCNGYCSLRDKEYKILTCDKCKRETDRLWNYFGKELCEDCLLEKFESEDGKCDECGSQNETIYLFDGSWYCTNCIKEQFEEIRDTD